MQSINGFTICIVIQRCEATLSCAQVALVFAYENSVPEDRWQALVTAASFMDQSKWALCRCTLALLALEATILLWVTIFSSRESAKED